jgi:hypothetical protein
MRPLRPWPHDSVAPFALFPSLTLRAADLSARWNISDQNRRLRYGLGSVGFVAGPCWQGFAAFGAAALLRCGWGDSPRRASVDGRFASGRAWALGQSPVVGRGCTGWGGCAAGVQVGRGCAASSRWSVLCRLLRGSEGVGTAIHGMNPMAIDTLAPSRLLADSLREALGLIFMSRPHGARLC